VGKAPPRRPAKQVGAQLAGPADAAFHEAAETCAVLPTLNGEMSCPGMRNHEPDFSFLFRTCEGSLARRRRVTVFQNSPCDTPLPALMLLRDLLSKIGNGRSSTSTFCMSKVTLGFEIGICYNTQRA
jgi:hypothetical protein